MSRTLSAKTLLTTLWMIRLTLNILRRYRPLSSFLEASHQIPCGQSWVNESSKHHRVCHQITPSRGHWWPEMTNNNFTIQISSASSSSSSPPTISLSLECNLWSDSAQEESRAKPARCLRSTICQNIFLINHFCLLRSTEASLFFGSILSAVKIDKCGAINNLLVGCVRH